MLVALYGPKLSLGSVNAGEEGPVIGIDLGTTYSWWVFFFLKFTGRFVILSVEALFFCYQCIYAFIYVCICSVGIYKQGQVEIIPNEFGNRITPSYVAFTSEGQRLVGDAAKNQLTSNPENTVYDIKRLIGRSWDDPAVQKDIKNYPFKVVNRNNRPAIQVFSLKPTLAIVSIAAFSFWLLSRFRP